MSLHAMRSIVLHRVVCPVLVCGTRRMPFVASLAQVSSRPHGLGPSVATDVVVIAPPAASGGSGHGLLRLLAVLSLAPVGWQVFLLIGQGAAIRYGSRVLIALLGPLQETLLSLLARLFFKFLEGYASWSFDVLECFSLGEESRPKAPDKMLSHRFYVIRAPEHRPGEWDEFFSLSLVPGETDRMICYSTDESNSRFSFYDVLFRIGHFRLMSGVGPQRSGPVGGRPDVDERAVNWVCRPGTATRWAPPPGPGLAALTEEATVLGAFVTPRAQRGRAAALEMGAEDHAVSEAGASGRPMELPIANAGPGIGVMPLAPPVAAAAASGNVGAAVPGPPGGAQDDDLRAALQALRGDLEALTVGKDKKRSGERSRRRRRDVSSGGSSSSGRRRRSRSGSSGSNSDRRRRRRKMAVWHSRSSGKRDPITPEIARNMETLRFRTRADLVRLSAERPGALACQFLLAVRQALNAEPAKSSKDLWRTDVMRWSRDSTGLKEVRDQREIQTLMLILQKLNEDQVEQAADVIAQRAKSLLVAKTAKGSWEKSATIELLASSSGVVPQSEIALSGLGLA